MKIIKLSKITWKLSWKIANNCNKAGCTKFCVSCFERLKNIGSDGRGGFFFYLKRKFQLKGGMCQLMYLKPGKTSAVKMCRKCIFGVKSAKKKKKKKI